MTEYFTTEVFGDTPEAMKQEATRQAAAFFGSGYTFQIKSFQASANPAREEKKLREQVHERVSQRLLTESARGPHRAAVAIRAEKNKEDDANAEAARYAQAVLDALARALPDICKRPLVEEHLNGVVRELLVDHYRDPQPNFGIGVDAVSGARWKLVANVASPRELELVSTALTPGPGSGLASARFKRAFANRAWTY